MKKITILALHLNYGGIETSIVNLANMLAERYQVQILVAYNFQSQLSHNINSKVNIEYYTNLQPNKQKLLLNLKNKNIFSFLKEGVIALYILYCKKIKTVKAIKNDDSQIIISTRIYFHKLVNKYAKKHQIKIIQEHSHHNYNKQYIKKVINSCSNADYFMAASKELTEYYNKKLPSTIKCIYIRHSIKFIPTKNLYNVGGDLISVGRLSREKGHISLIDIFNKVKDFSPNIMLHIYGDGDMRTLIEQKIIKNGLQKNIVLHGFQNLATINRQYEKSSLFILPSHEESFGLVLIEAMAFGIPCLAFSSATGASEIINGQNGKIIPNRDHVKMSNEIKFLLNNPSKLKRMSAVAYKTAKKYSYVEVQKEWLSFIEKIKEKNHE